MMGSMQLVDFTKKFAKGDKWLDDFKNKQGGVMVKQKSLLCVPRGWETTIACNMACALGIKKFSNRVCLVISMFRWWRYTDES